MSSPSPPAGRPLRVWAISEVAPDGGGAGGHATMRRHFVDRSVGSIVWSTRADALAPRGPVGRAADRLWNRALRTRVRSVLTGLQPAWEALPNRVAAAEPTAALGGPADLIFTVAHGTAWLTARRVARALDRPLATVFHDWYPDVPDLPAPLRAHWDRAFRRLSRDSAVTLCVSEGMRSELGPHPNALVLPPIPADPPSHRATRRAIDGPIRLFYAGLCGGYYAKALGALIRSVAADGRFGLDLCGIGTEALPTDGGPRVRIHGDVPAELRQAIAAGADAALVTLPFDPARTRHLRTHFPSKLIEYCGLGRPLIVWGPPYASAIDWANRTGAAVPASDPNPAALLETVARSLADGGAERSAIAAGELARTTFAPDAIHERLLDALHGVAGVPRPERSPLAAAA